MCVYECVCVRESGGKRDREREWERERERDGEKVCVRESITVPPSDQHPALRFLRQRLGRARKSECERESVKVCVRQKESVDV